MKNMEPPKIIEELAANKKVFASLFDGLNKTQYYWKPSGDKWCILEILCHLYDEEREDFRARTKQILESIDKPFDPIDPVGWVESRKYKEQNFDEKLVNFMDERQKSIYWLQSLEKPNWDNFYKHPLFGEMTARMFLANWLAHDYIHIRQIIKLKYAFLKNKSGQDLTYAGDWKD